MESLDPLYRLAALSDKLSMITAGIAGIGNSHAEPDP